MFQKKEEMGFLGQSSWARAAGPELLGQMLQKKKEKGFLGQSSWARAPGPDASQKGKKKNFMGQSSWARCFRKRKKWNCWARAPRPELLGQMLQEREFFGPELLGQMLQEKKEKDFLGQSSWARALRPDASEKGKKQKLPKAYLEP